FRQNGQLVTEASVSATATTAARIFVDQIQTRTGIAIANTATQTATVTLTLLDPFGSVETSTTRTIAGLGHLSIFADELFPGVAPDGFTGLMDIRSTVPVAPIALKITVNKRSEQVLTTLPVADLTKPRTARSSVFAHLVIGAPFATRLLLLNVDP